MKFKITLILFLVLLSSVNIATETKEDHEIKTLELNYNLTLNYHNQILTGYTKYEVKNDK